MKKFSLLFFLLIATYGYTQSAQAASSLIIYDELFPTIPEIDSLAITKLDSTNIFILALFLEATRKRELIWGIYHKSTNCKNPGCFVMHYPVIRYYIKDQEEKTITTKYGSDNIILYHRYEGKNWTEVLLKYIKARSSE